MTQEEKDQLAELIETMSKQLDQRERIVHAQAKRAQGLSRARKAKEDARHKRQQSWMKFIGAAGVVMSLVMLAFILSIWFDMNEMRRQMVAMGGYMENMIAMTDDMRQMRTSMSQMNDSMGSMKTNFETMTGDMGTVRQVMSDMGDKMTPSVVSMSRDMAEMNQSVKGMNYDTSVMRTGVYRMSRDTDAMGQPFRAMDDFIPW